MFKEMLLKKMLKLQMKGIPEEEQEKMLKIILANPELFQKIGIEAQEKIKQGKSQMTAMTEVMGKYQSELQKILG